MCLAGCESACDDSAAPALNSYRDFPTSCLSVVVKRCCTHLHDTTCRFRSLSWHVLGILSLPGIAVQRRQMTLLSLLAALPVLSLSATAAARGRQQCLLSLLKVASTVLLLGE